MNQDFIPYGRQTISDADIEAVEAVLRSPFLTQGPVVPAFEEGLTKAVGLAMGKIDLMFPMIKNWDFDVLINHNRYTLLNREANEMYDYAYSKNIAIINAAPYAGGVLAKGPSNFKKITYQDVSEEKLAPAREIEKICKKYNIEIGAAALQFSLKDKRIASTLCGVTSVESIEKKS